MRRTPGEGLLVVLEGIDGAGKSTQIRLLSERLVTAGIPAVVSREPTDGPHGRRLRESATRGRLEPSEELELFLADRREHVAQLILPSLAAGKVVVLDRYYFSTAAYQGARGFDWREIIRQNEEFAPEPDLLFWFDLSPMDSQARIGRRGEGENAFEKLEALKSVARLYECMMQGRKYVRRVDARAPSDQLGQQIWEQVVGTGLGVVIGR